MLVVLLSAGTAGLLSARPAALRPAPCLRSRPVRVVDLSARPQDESVVEQLGGGGIEEVATPATPDVPGFAEPARGPLWQLGVLWRFTRPHTLIGSALCVPALLAFAAPPGTLLSAPLGYGLLWALVPSLLINLYITGLNQLYDIELDRVNKPTLPLAAGDMSPVVGAAVVLSSLVSGLALGWVHPRYCTDALRATLIGSALLGTAYSAPPLRLKRFPLLAGLCIMGVPPRVTVRVRVRVRVRVTDRAVHHGGAPSPLP